MRRNRRQETLEESEDEESDTEDEATMKCVSCKEEYGSCDAGTCRECYEEASETEEELKREIEELKAKVNFLRFWVPLDHLHRSATPCFTDVVLVASGDHTSKPHSLNPIPVPAHKAVLVRTHYTHLISYHIYINYLSFIYLFIYFCEYRQAVRQYLGQCLRMRWRRALVVP